MIARAVKPGVVIGRFQVTAVLDNVDPYTQVGSVGILLFDMLNRSYSRHAFRPRDVIDVHNLPRWD